MCCISPCFFDAWHCAASCFPQPFLSSFFLVGKKVTSQSTRSLCMCACQPLPPVSTPHTPAQQGPLPFAFAVSRHHRASGPACLCLWRSCAVPCSLRTRVSSVGRSVRKTPATPSSLVLPPLLRFLLDTLGGRTCALMNGPDTRSSTRGRVWLLSACERCAFAANGITAPAACARSSCRLSRDPNRSST